MAMSKRKPFFPRRYNHHAYNMYNIMIYTIMLAKFFFFFVGVESRDHWANTPDVQRRLNINLRDPSLALATPPPRLNSVTNHHRSCVATTAVVYNDNIIVIEWKQCYRGWQKKKENALLLHHPRRQTRDERNDTGQTDCREGGELNFLFLALSQHPPPPHAPKPAGLSTWCKRLVTFFAVFYRGNGISACQPKGLYRTKVL